MIRRNVSPILIIALGMLYTSARAMPELIIDPKFGSTERTGASAAVEFNFSESRFGDLVTLTLRNTTPSEIGSRLTAVGMELPDFLVDRPSIVKADMDNYFDTLTYDDPMSPGWLNAADGYDLVLSSDGSFLGGNPNGAPRSGEFSRIVLLLGDTGLSPEQLASAFEQFYGGTHQPFVLGRFQSVGPNGQFSDKVAGGVPEPATLVLLAFGALVATRKPIRKFRQRGSRAGQST